MTPVKFVKVTKKYIKEKINKLNLDDENKKDLFNITLEEIRRKRFYLKDMNTITYWIAKYHLEIAFYSKETYWTKSIDITRK